MAVYVKLAHAADLPRFAHECIVQIGEDHERRCRTLTVCNE